MTKTFAGKVGWGWLESYDGEEYINIHPDVTVVDVYPTTFGNDGKLGVGIATKEDVVFKGSELIPKPKMGWVDVTKECTTYIHTSGAALSVIGLKHNGVTLGYFGTEGLQMAMPLREGKGYSIETGEGWTQSDGNPRQNYWFNIKHWQEQG